MTFLNHRLYNQVRNQIHTKMHRLRIQLRGQLHKQLIKEHGLHYEGWVPIREQVHERLYNKVRDIVRK